MTNIIDEFTIEFNLTAELFAILLPTSFQDLNDTGENGRAMIDLRVFVVCADGWNGTNCEMFCNSSGCITGISLVIIIILN